MAKDLEEFTKVVTEDASTVYTAVAEATYQSINDYAGEEIANDAVEIKSTAVNLLGTGLKTLVSVTEQILLDTDDEDEEPEEQLTLEEAIAKLQADNSTYTTDIDHDGFKDWLDKFISDIDKKKEEISELLIEQPKVRRKYNELVPKDVSHNLFWARYLYRTQLQEQKYAEKEEKSQENSEIENTESEKKVETVELEQKSESEVAQSEPVKENLVQKSEPQTIETPTEPKNVEPVLVEPTVVEEKVEVEVEKASSDESIV